MAASIMPLVMTARMNTALMNPEKAFGATLRYRIDWDTAVGV